MDITVSVISHLHGAAIQQLIGQLAALADPMLRRVIVTLNVPEPALATALSCTEWPFELNLVRNAQRAGFGANHNRAFALDRGRDPSPLFAVINPDVRLLGNPFGAMIESLSRTPRAGVVYPVQIDAVGRLQDHERRIPTPARLLARYRPGRRRPELSVNEPPDWVNAAFLLFRSEAYEAVSGFDERYHMYCEDVDLCLRLQLADWRLQRSDAAIIEHRAQRASHDRLQYLFWHFASLLRLWRSHAWHAYRNRSTSEHRSFDTTHFP